MNFKQVKGKYLEEIRDGAEWFTKSGVATDRRFGDVPQEEDWWDALSPIEQDLWEVTRGIYGQFLLPQWPVNNYFLDFANPITKIAFECDGKQWHDAARDFKRDTQLRQVGWTIYRLPGSVCHKRMDEPSYVLDPYDMSDLREGYKMSHDAETYVHEFLTTTLDGFMQCFTNVHWAKDFPDLARDVVSKYLSPACRGVSAGRGLSDIDVTINEAFAKRHEIFMFGEYLFCLRAVQHFSILTFLSEFTHQWNHCTLRGYDDNDRIRDLFLEFMEKHPFLIRLYQSGIDPRCVDRMAVLEQCRSTPTYLYEYAESMRCSDDED